MVSHLCDNEHCGHPGSDHLMDSGKCSGEITDLYGTWTCLCFRFERDPDE
jgi:hypothetical protein